MTARPIVADSQFIMATRDSGYRGVAAAVAELVDNALQAGAKNIQILIQEDRPRVAGVLASRELTIAVFDDGRGMTRGELWSAVQFGGTGRFNDRSGLGRFGMGLPNSSVSVTRRVEVYSWQHPGEVLHTYLDVDEVAQQTRQGIPEPTYRPLPLWAAEDAGASGTIVVWPRCDRLDYKKAATVVEKLHLPLGRMYRQAIWSGTRITVNGQVVAAIDPLFCHVGAKHGGAVSYGTPLSYEVMMPGGSRSARIVVRFTELPVSLWHDWSAEDKRAHGIVGGAGASFVRAGREIDYGWHLFGAKRRENYDDWWRCEIAFEPALDELFGVTHSKQGVSPTPYLRSILEPDLEVAARALNARVRVAFGGIERTAPSKAAVRASRQDHLLPVIHSKPLPTPRGLSYRIAFAAIPERDFFQVRERRGTVELTINTDHPFYDHLYEPAIADRSGQARYAIECLLLAAGRGSLQVARDGPRDGLDTFLEAWSDALAAFLETKTLRQ